ncbi:MAG TPA: PAS domain S-box protein, partial [Verrucomicrobiae bacterium]|nr:PAS domain S-box protein [Verrucomicrobiae bacterium]
MLLVAAAALLLSAGAFLTYEVLAFRAELRDQVETLAHIVARNCTAALVFQDDKDADEVLSGLEEERHLLAGAVYTRDGRLFAQYRRPGESGSAAVIPQTPAPLGARFERGSLVVFNSVMEGQRQVGTIYLQMSVAALNQRVKVYLLTLTGILLASLGLAWFLSWKLQRGVSRPILALTQVAHAIAERRDYSVRAEKSSEDELGVLTDAFNQMLERIQSGEEARRLLVAIVESSDDAIIGKDLQQHILSWNVGAEKMFGYTAEEVIGRTVEFLIPEQYRAQEQEVFTIVSRGKPAHLESVRVRKDGSLFPISLSVSPIRDNRGRIIGGSFISRDITRQKEAEAELLRLKEDLEHRVHERTAELEAANKEMEAFSYSVAHDLRAPLRHIDAYAQVLKGEFAETLNPEIEKYLDRISNSSRNLGHLVDDLLNLARIGRQDVMRQRTSLRTLVDEVIEELKEDIGTRRVEWHIGALPEVNADPGLVKQVYANLLGNAVKYSRTRALAVIEIGAKEEGHETVLYVRDNGVGFNMKYAHKLFGVFQRLHRSEDFEGTGIGLASAARIVQKHGGRIWAEA